MTLAVTLDVKSFATRSSWNLEFGSVGFSKHLLNPSSICFQSMGIL